MQQRQKSWRETIYFYLAHVYTMALKNAIGDMLNNQLFVVGHSDAVIKAMP